MPVINLPSTADSGALLAGFWACLFVCWAAVADMVRSYKVQLPLVCSPYPG